MAWNTWSQDSDSNPLYSQILRTSKRGSGGGPKPQVQPSVPIVFSCLGCVGDVAQLDKCLPKSWAPLPAPHQSGGSFLYSHLCTLTEHRSMVWGHDWLHDRFPGTVQSHKFYLQVGSEEKNPGQSLPPDWLTDCLFSALPPQEPRNVSESKPRQGLFHSLLYRKISLKSSLSPLWYIAL